jgi:hypothetical protein
VFDYTLRSARQPLEAFMTAKYRYRSKGSINGNVTVTQEGYPLSCSNRIYGVINPGSTSSLIYTGSAASILDFVEPNYFKQRAMGAVIIHPYVRRLHSIEVTGDTSVTHTSVPATCTGPTIYGYYVDKGAYFAWTLAYSGHGPGHSQVPTIDGNRVNNLQDEAITEALSKRQQGGSNYLESLAEADQAFHLVLNPLENVIRLLREFRRKGKRKKGYERIKSDSSAVIEFAASEWLRLRYGLMPLVRDVKAGMAALEKGYNKKPVIHRARSKFSIEGVAASNSSFVIYPYLITYQKITRRRVDVKAVFYDKYSKSIWDELGINLQNILGLPWELINKSFVADWFANIGELIYANLPRVGIIPCGGAVTVFDETVSVWSPTGTSSSAPSVWTVSGNVSDQLKETTVSATRNIFGERSASLVIKDDFKFDVWTRALDASALVSQLLQRIRF